MRSEIRVQPVFQRILYSQSWEDPQADLAALDVGETDDVLAIAASGDNVLALLTANPRSLTGIDFSLSQVCLVELKMAGFLTLSYPELLEFLGVESASGARRLELFLRVRAELSDVARDFWDSNPGLLKAGVIHIGRFEKYLGMFRRYVLPLIHGRRTVRRFLDSRDLEEQQRIYHEVWNTRLWRGLFRIFFGRRMLGRLGRDPAFFKYVELDRVGDEFLGRAQRAFCDMPVQDNHFVEYILTGGYAGRTRLPVYLREENFELLRNNVERVQLVNDEIEGFLPSRDPGAFSKYYLSDIFEWMSPEAFEDLLKAFVRVGRSGGRLAYRNLLVLRDHPAALDEVLESDPERGAEILKSERSFVWGRFVIETIR